MPRSYSYCERLATRLYTTNVNNWLVKTRALPLEERLNVAQRAAMGTIIVVGVLYGAYSLYSFFAPEPLPPGEVEIVPPYR